MTKLKKKKTGISYSNQNKPLATIKLERKRKSDCNNQFPPLSLTLLFSHSLPLCHSFSPTDCRNMCKYVKMHASTYTNILTLNNTHTHTQPPLFKQKLTILIVFFFVFFLFFFYAFTLMIADCMKPRVTESAM